MERWRKPFNPILGETWQATMPGGLCLAMEQVRCLQVAVHSAFDKSGVQCGWHWGIAQPVVQLHRVSSCNHVPCAQPVQIITLADYQPSI